MISPQSLNLLLKPWRMLRAWANIAFSMAYVTFFTPPAQLHAGIQPPREQNDRQV